MLAGRTNDPEPPVDAITGVSIFVEVVPKVTAALPVPVFSSIDRDGRYAYANQPAIAHWNLARLAESLVPLVPGDEAAAVDAVRAPLATFPERYARSHLRQARAKLGLANEEAGDADLFAGLLTRMHETRADFTATFASLAALAEATPDAAGPLPRTLADWLPAWRARLARQPGSPADAAVRMRRVNPVVIPRNHRVEEALAAAEAGDLAPLHRLLAALREPFATTPANAPYRGGPPSNCGPYRTFCGT